jgi:predicted molibdopterin-dependent oxidoreductase YjgC
MDKITINVNGQDYQVETGQNVLQACQSIGIDIPNICWHPRTKVYGGCRLCIVEIEGMRGFPISCGTDVQDKMKIVTENDKIRQVRKTIVELMIASGEHVCITCEMSGSCDLQRLAYEYGIEKPRFDLRGTHMPIDDANPFIIRDYNKCILCGRCVRLCNEVIEEGAISIMRRGMDAKIACMEDTDLIESNCKMCGSCVQACPTGALSYKKARFKGRPSDTKTVETTCSYCGCGCQLEMHVKNGEVIYVDGADEAPNYGTTCVKGRFGFDYIHNPARLTLPLVRKDGELVETSWDEALDLIADKFKEIKEKNGKDAFMVASSAKATNEENYALMKFTRAVLGTNNIDHCARL